MEQNREKTEMKKLCKSNIDEKKVGKEKCGSKKEGKRQKGVKYFDDIWDDLGRMLYWRFVKGKMGQRIFAAKLA